MLSSIMIFAILCGIVATVILRRFEVLEKSELVSYVVLIAWASMFFGMLVARSAAAGRF